MHRNAFGDPPPSQCYVNVTQTNECIKLVKEQTESLFLTGKLPMLKKVVYSIESHLR